MNSSPSPSPSLSRTRIPAEDVLVGTAVPLPTGDVDVKMGRTEAQLTYKGKVYFLKVIHYRDNGRFDSDSGSNSDHYWCRMVFSDQLHCPSHWSVVYYPHDECVNFYFTHTPNPRIDTEDVVPFGDLHTDGLGKTSIANPKDHKIFPHTFTFQLQDW